MKSCVLKTAALAVLTALALMQSAAAAALPDADRARFGLALSYCNLERYAEARPLLSALYARYPGRDDIALAHVRALGFGGDAAAAAAVLAKLRQRHPGDRELDLLEASILEANRQFARAYAVYARLLERQPADGVLLGRAARCATWAGDHDSAVALHERLVRQRPHDRESAAGLAGALYAAGKFTEAEAAYRGIWTRWPEAAGAGMKLGELLALRQAYGQARQVYEAILAREPDNREARLQLARTLSWAESYREALAQYDRLIAGDSRWVLPRREKARVLGWKRSYRSSVREYERIFQDIGPDSGARAELAAKRAFYNRFDMAGARAYRQWLALEPDDLEALYDLGQVYSRQEQWADARRMYRRTLELLPAHFRARQSLEKLELVSTRPLVEAGIETDDAKSGERAVDRHCMLYYAALQVPVTQDVSVRLRHDQATYHFSDLAHVRRRTDTLVLAYTLKPRFWGRAGYSYNAYSDGIENSHTFFAVANIRPHDMAVVRLSHHRRDVIENSRTLRKDLQKDDYLGRLDFTPHRRLALGADYQYSNYTDSNNRRAYGADLSFWLTFEPSSLMFFYRYEQYAFDRSKPDYFSPSCFHYNRVGLEFRQFLNREELFWGINETYVSFRYWLIYEPHGQRGHAFYADFHHDLTGRLAVHVECRRTLYEDQSIYKDQQITAYIRYRF